MRTYKLYTLVFLRSEDKILLGLKKRGFGVGRWNGFGGKVQENESVEDAAQRELFEECGLMCHNLSKVAVLRFEFENDPVIMEVHTFVGTSITGEVLESDEMLPKWFDITNIPFQQMWPDDIIWFPNLLENRKFIGYFLFRGYDTILDYKIDEDVTEI